MVNAWPALITWLLAESLGAWMLVSWLRGRRTPAGGPASERLPALWGHASLALTGLTCWVIFLVTAAPVAAWLSIGFLAPAIGLGISTVTVWTPFPGRAAGGADAGSAPLYWRGSIPDDVLARSLEDDELAGKVVDDLLAGVFSPAPDPRQPGLAAQLKPVIPIVHGLLALATFFLAMLAAVDTLT
jgi:hypothetical protein